jgi:hypothetical protein
MGGEGKRGKERREGGGEEGEGYNRARDEEGKGEEEYRDDEGEKNTALFAHTPTSLLNLSTPHRSTPDIIYETTPPLCHQSQSLAASSAKRPHSYFPSPAPAHHHLQEPQKTEVTMTTTATKENNEDLLYPPHQLSPKAPFKFPSPLPSRVPSPAPVSQSSSSSSSSFSYEGTFRALP